MARKKISLAFMTNRADRRCSYIKRKKGLVKKVSELSILCGVDACAVINSDEFDKEPEVWPSRDKALEMYLNLDRIPEMDSSKRVMDQEGFMSSRIEKSKNQINRFLRENNQNEIDYIMHKCMSGKGSLEKFDFASCSSDMNTVRRHTLMHVNAMIEARKKDNHRNPADLTPEVTTTLAAQQGEESSNRFSWFEEDDHETLQLSYILNDVNTDPSSFAGPSNTAGNELDD